jgi:hypothetical protein
MPTGMHSGVHNSEYLDLRYLGFKVYSSNSRFQAFEDSRVQRFPRIKFYGFKVQSFESSGFGCFKVSGFRGF